MKNMNRGQTPILIRTLTPIVFLLLSGAAMAQDCRVLDPELQGLHAGPCVNGLAEGEGMARGTADYRGGFSAGRKHGRGVKAWPNGDRYEGEFAEDRKHGRGVYVWGKGPWAGERYEGDFSNDRRHGSGEYRYASGDVYRGPWDNDIATGPPTPMRQARAKFEEEARAAVAQEGRKVCREMEVGIGGRDWVRGVVVALEGGKAGVRIDDAGSQAHLIGGAEARVGAVVWDVPGAWTPCW